MKTFPECKVIALTALIAISFPALAAEALSTGTAFAIAPDALVTNHHVIAGCAVLDVISQGKRYRVDKIESDPRVDLALLRVPNLNSPIAMLRNPAAVQLGEPVSVFGFPLSGALSSGGNFTTGLVSALQGLNDNAGDLQITAPVQPGNSGGPLLDASGLVIGVVQSKLNALMVMKAIGDIPQNVNFAISSNSLTGFLKQRKAAYSNVEPGEQLTSTKIAAMAQSFTQRVECMSQGSQTIAAGPLPNRRIAPPIPEFVDTDARLAYLHWLGTVGNHLTSPMPDAQTRLEFLQTVWYESKRAGLNTALVLSMIENLSNFRRYAVDVNGARGFMQVKPSWAREIGDGDTTKLLHMQTNLRFGCVILRHYLEVNSGNTSLAVRQYLNVNIGLAINSPELTSRTNRILAQRARWIDQ